MYYHLVICSERFGSCYAYNLSKETLQKIFDEYFLAKVNVSLIDDHFATLEEDSYVDIPIPNQELTFILRKSNSIWEFKFTHDNKILE